MDQKDLNYFTQKLEAERALLEEELKSIARVNPRNPDDWEAVPAERDETTFRDEVADRLEELDSREATVTPLETRLHQINLALTRLQTDIYGRCRVCQQFIERPRLEANAAADTCKQHLEQTDANIHHQ